MRTWILLLLFSITFLFADDDLEILPSSPEHIANFALHSETPVSPLTGQLSLLDLDLVAKGAQDVLLRRIYIAPQLPDPIDDNSPWEEYKLIRYLRNAYQGWTTLPHHKAFFYFENKTMRITTPEGITLDFALKDEKFELSSPTYGMSNIYENRPSGRYDLRNTQITLSNNKRTLTVTAPEGTLRTYQYQRTGIGKASYLLEKELLPHGKLLRYYYTDAGNLRLMESKDIHDQHTYASIRIEPESSALGYITSTGRKATYQYESREKSIKVKDGHKKLETHQSLPPLLTKVSSPLFRHEELQYNSKHLLEKMLGKENIFACTYKPFHGHKIPSHLRIQELKLPIGKDDAFETVYTFDYDLPRAGKKEGITHVKSAEGRETIYHFSKDLLLEKQQIKNKGILEKETLFHYRQTPDHWLESVEIKDQEGKCLQKNHFEYDSFGNPSIETIIGHLTGEEESEESYKIWKHYSKDGRHLLLIEDHEDGRSYHYDYLPGTNLPTKKLTFALGKIYTREFYEYDNCNNLIKKILDDGSFENKDDLAEVTERHITTYILRQEQPFLHLPEWIEESALEGLLTKTHVQYDDHGNIASKEIYNAEGKLAYTLKWFCNEQDKVLVETNALGFEKHFDYDPRGRKTFESSFSGRLHEVTTHDLKGRVKKFEQTGHTISRVIRFEHDPYDQLILKEDHFGNTTTYTPNHLVKKPAHITYPPISSQPVEKHIAHDCLGHEISSTDPCGYTTTTQYNLYGSPILIQHPNGSSQVFRYYKNGKLKKQQDQEGLVILYTYDPLWRIETKTFFSKEGNEIAKESFTYSSFHLKTYTDKEGYVTTYEYDAAGRKIQETKCGRVTLFSYDDFGRLFQITEDPRITEFSYDLLGQLLCKKKLDLQGKLLFKIKYTYDKDNRLATITTYPQNKKALETFVYDPLGRQIEHHDPLGFIKKTTYNETGSQLQMIETDEKGYETIKTYDAHHNLVSKQTPLGKTALFYDPSSHLLERHDHAESGSTQKMRCTYTPSGTIETLARAFDTALERITVYTYTPSGKIETKTLPDGTLLKYTYSPLGPLAEIASSEGSIHHSFAYNKLGHLLGAVDLVNQIAIKRTSDPFGNVLLEEFSTGIAIQKSYDHFNRPLALELPSGTIRYTYDPCYLKKIERFSKNHDLLFAQHYEAYDLSGNLLSETLIHDLGQQHHAYDPIGRKAQQTSPYSSESYSYDERGDVSSIVKNGTVYNYSYDALSQIATEPLYEYLHDGLYNRKEMNGISYAINALNELEEFTYDTNGNLKTKGPFTFSYDALNRLTEVSSQDTNATFLYDPLDRRLIKRSTLETEIYLYDGMEEIGAFTLDGHQKNLKIATCAIELDGKPFLPLRDFQNNITVLIDPVTKVSSATYSYNTFGETLASQEQIFNPWRAFSKRLDPETELIYFGKRYYVPDLGRWLTPDPAGFIDSVNLYQYVFNNPFRYNDPDGQFAIAIPLITWGSKLVMASLPTIAGYLGLGFATAAVAYGGYKLTDSLNYRSYSAEDHFYFFKNIEIEEETKKDDPPKSNTDQNKQAKDAKKEIERNIGRKLTKDEEREFHDHVTGQKYNYHELVEEGVWLFNE